MCIPLLGKGKIGLARVVRSLLPKATKRNRDEHAQAKIALGTSDLTTLLSPHLLFSISIMHI